MSGITAERGLHIAPGLTLPLDVVTEATAIVATRGAGKSSTGAVIVEEAFRNSVPVVVIDWTGVFWGLRSTAKGDGAGLAIYVLGGQHGDVPLEAGAGKIIADLVVDSGHSFVLDLSDFNKGQMRRFCADFLEHLYDRKARARTTLLLMIDEAHELAPQSPRGGFKGDAARLISAMEQVAALGRSRGIGVLMITQRTQALNKAVLDLIETLLIMRMLSPRAVAAVRDWILVKNEDDEEGVLPTLKKLPNGTAWVWSPLRGILQKVAVRRIRTFDSYKTPEPGQVAVEPKARKELDLAALGAQMAATVERAKADDPRELRKEIATLTRELNQVIQETEGQLVAISDALTDKLGVEVFIPTIVETIRGLRPERVEVPVLGAEIVDQLEATLSPAVGLLGELQETLVKHRIWAEDQLAVTRTPEGAKQGTSPDRSSAPVAIRPDAGVRGSRTSGTPTAQVRPAAERGETRPSPAAGTEEVTLGKTERTILAVLAQHGSRTHAQLALLSGYSAKASTIGNSLGKLRRAGYVEPNAPITATEAGIAWLGNDYEPLPQGDGLLHYWRHKFGKTEQRILDAFLEVFPMDTTQAEVAAITGYSPTASTIGNSLGKLRRVGVIDRWRLSDEFAQAIGRG